ncbi:MAG: hypothetical protein IJB80_05715 [Clostridia bacterium]|nr:hypothetical protein [Clostridia bacterium]
MTHPDILKMERFGSLNPNDLPRKVGVCLCCGEALYDDMPDLTESTDGLFCDMACCHEHYGIDRAY